MFSFEDETKRALSAGDTQMNEFSGAVRNLDATVLSEGDVITFPTDYTGKVFKTTFGENEAQYVLCQCKNKEGVESILRFYPSTFTKQRTVYEKTEPGKPLKVTNTRARTTGDAAEHYRSFANVNEAMNTFKGRTIKVTKMNKVWTKRFDRDALMEAQMPQIDFVVTK